MSYEILICNCGNAHYEEDHLNYLEEDGIPLLHEQGQPFYKLTHTMIYDIGSSVYDKNYRTGNMYVCSACGTLKIDLDNDWRI